MPIYLEMPNLNPDFRFKFLKNIGDILTTPHWHKEYELLLITHGEVNLGINDKQYHLKENQIAFFNSGDIHYVVASPDSERYVYQFDLNFFSDVLLADEKINLESVFEGIEQISFLWSSKVQADILDILKKIANECDDHQVGYEFAIESLLYQLTVIMIREVPRKKHPATRLSQIKSKQILETLNQVFKFVEDNYKPQIL